MQAFERLDAVQKNVQAGIDKIAGGYRAAARAAADLANAVERMNRAQAGARTAPALSAAPAAAMPMAAAAPQTTLPPTRTQSQGAISGPGFTMLPGNPGTALVPVGPGRQWDKAGPSPDRGALAIWAAQNGWTPPSHGTPQGDPYVPQGGAIGPYTGREYGPVDLGPLPSTRDRGPGRGAFPMNDAIVAGAGAGAGGYAGVEVLRKIFDAGLDIGATQSNLLTQGFTTQDVATALASAKATQRGTIGSSVGGNLEIVSMLMAMTQDPGAAIRLMPGYAQLAVALNASGHGGRQIGELTAAMTGAELRGVLYSKNAAGQEVLDENALGLFLKENLAVSTMTHGRIGPAEITQFLKSGGISAGMTTNQALFADALPLMIAMGPARAGTALQGFGQQFSSGKMSEAAMNLLAEMDIIIDKHRARKMGMGQFMLLPGAMRQGDVEMARDAPATFIMDRLLPQIDKYLVKNFGKTFTGADDRRRTQMEAGAFQQVASRIPGGNEMAETLRNNPLILRDREAFRKAMDRDAAAIQTQNNPKVVVEGLNAAISGLMISLASPNMKTGTSALSDLTHAINWASAQLDKHPNAARYMVDLAAGMTAVAIAAAAAMATIVPAVAAAKLIKYAAGPSAASKTGTGTAAAIGGAASRLAGLPLAVGLGVHELDSNDAAGRWIDKHIPGAAAVDDFFYRHTGGVVGRPRDGASAPAAPDNKAGPALMADQLADYNKTHPINVQTTNHIYIDGKKVQTTTSTSPGVQSGTTGHDPRMSLYPAGAVAGSGQ